MKLLELSSRTGSVGTVAKDMGWDVVSLDLKGADINCDILQWKYKKYPEILRYDLGFSPLY
jgi:hypothetical protein